MPSSSGNGSSGISDEEKRKDRAASMLAIIVMIAGTIIVIAVLAANHFDYNKWLSQFVSKKDNKKESTENPATTQSEEVVERVYLSDIAVNGSEDDYETKLDRMRVDETVYYHAVVRLENIEEVKIKYSIIFPNGGVEENEFDNISTDGNRLLVWAWIDNPEEKDIGREIITFYRVDNDEPIESIAIDLIKGENESLYIVFPDSSERYLEEDEVQCLNKDEVQLAINEIYARNGYDFEENELGQFYSNFDWYKPTISADEFDDGCFSDIERENLNLLFKWR